MWMARSSAEFFFFNATAPTEIYTLSLHDALPISLIASSAAAPRRSDRRPRATASSRPDSPRSEEHTSELQSLRHLVCRLLLEKKKEVMLKEFSVRYVILGHYERRQHQTDSDELIS